jgi:4-diphosphocytidyl-2-C-methyl-D-erythritol kinase
VLIPLPPSPPSSTQRVTARALAKINLHLAIHGRRPDGYHELTTVFQSIALHDAVTIQPYDGPFVLRCTDPALPVDDSNLVWRAASAYADAVGRAPLSGLRVTLDKQVPVQAGLGGGSADAMATLRALARCWGLDAQGALLMAIGQRLGADVPFFVAGGTALGTGRGDALTPLPDLPRHALAIVRPPFGVGTADAYRWVTEARQDQAATGIDGPPTWPTDPIAWRDRFDALHNDFEPVVTARFPVVADIVSALRDQGAVLACLSGSGSAVVGLFSRDCEAAAAAGIFERRPGWRVWTSETVGTQAYRAAVEPLNL